ncbi:MAG TPA: TIGR04211 family SH3 domain-containing protein [Cellvibrio sp.]|nr:TIGR04211 family SH3 domain-containing protein [Cellvibrio sp.]
MKNIKNKQANIHIRKISLASLISATVLTTGLAVPSFAEDRYVSDIIYIPLRSDKDSQASVIKNGLGTGTKLTFIREEEDANKNKWSLVITPDQMEGWVRSQNLISEPTAAMKLAAITSGSSDIVELQKQNINLKTELDSLKSTHQKLLKETEEMRNTTASDINMEQENQNMHREFQLLQTERDVLKAENDKLKNTDRYAQRLNGGALLLGGVILSFLLQLIGRRKRRSEWN